MPQVEAAVAMLKKLRLPEFAAPDAQPGRDLPAFQLGTLPNPQLQRHYQARSVYQACRQYGFPPSSWARCPTPSCKPPPGALGLPGM